MRTRLNATDFYLGDTAAGTFGPLKARLATPGPRGLTSARSAGLIFTLADPSKTATTFPNRYRVNGATATTGTYFFRWKVTNTSAVAMHTLRLRVAKAPTLNSPGYVPGGAQADFRLVSSADAAAFSVPIDGTVIARGPTIEAPPTGLPQDGGNNSSAAVALPGGVLGPGSSVYVNVAFRYAQGGNYSYWITGEGKP